MKNKNISLTNIKALNVVADAFDYKATASSFGRHAMFLSEDELIQAAKYSQLAAYEFGTANHLKTGSSRRNTWNRACRLRGQHKGLEREMPDNTQSIS